MSRTDALAHTMLQENTTKRSYMQDFAALTTQPRHMCNATTIDTATTIRLSSKSDSSMVTMWMALPKYKLRWMGCQ